MKKKLFSILLSLAMVVTMMPAMTFTAYADDENHTLQVQKIGGEEAEEDVDYEWQNHDYFGYILIIMSKDLVVTGGTQDDPSNESITVTADNVTLKNVNIEGGTLNVNSNNCEVTILGTNTIRSLTYGSAIAFNNGGGKIQGTGTLNLQSNRNCITAVNLNIDAAKINAKTTGEENYAAIITDHDMTITGNSEVVSSCEGSCTLCAGGKLSILDNSKVKAENNCNSSTIWSDGNMKISTTGQVEAINHAASNAIGTESKLSILGNSKVKAENSYSPTIWSDGSITISDRATVEVTNKEIGLAFETEDDLAISGNANVKASSNSQYSTIWVNGDIEISTRGSVEVTNDGDDSAIGTEGSLTIGKNIGKFIARGKSSSYGAIELYSAKALKLAKGICVSGAVATNADIKSLTKKLEYKETQGDAYTYFINDEYAGTVLFQKSSDACKLLTAAGVTAATIAGITAGVSIATLSSFEAYKSKAKRDCDVIANRNSSKKIKGLVYDAMVTIDNTRYDARKTLSQNKAAVKKIVTELKEKVAAASLE